LRISSQKPNVDCDGFRRIGFAAKKSSDVGDPHDHSVAIGIVRPETEP